MADAIRSIGVTEVPMTGDIRTSVAKSEALEELCIGVRSKNLACSGHFEAPFGFDIPISTEQSIPAEIDHREVAAPTALVDEM